MKFFSAAAYLVGMLLSRTSARPTEIRRNTVDRAEVSSASASAFDERRILKPTQTWVDDLSHLLRPVRELSSFQEDLGDPQSSTSLDIESNKTSSLESGNIEDDIPILRKLLCGDMEHEPMFPIICLHAGKKTAPTLPVTMIQDWIEDIDDHGSEASSHGTENRLGRLGTQNEASTASIEHENQVLGSEAVSKPLQTRCGPPAPSATYGLDNRWLIRSVAGSSQTARSYRAAYYSPEKALTDGIFTLDLLTSRTIPVISSSDQSASTLEAPDTSQDGSKSTLSAIREAGRASKTRSRLISTTHNGLASSVTIVSFPTEKSQDHDRHASTDSEHISFSPHREVTYLMENWTREMMTSAMSTIERPYTANRISTSSRQSSWRPKQTGSIKARPQSTLVSCLQRSPTARAGRHVPGAHTIDKELVPGDRGTESDLERCLYDLSSISNGSSPEHLAGNSNTNRHPLDSKNGTLRKSQLIKAPTFQAWIKGVVKRAKFEFFRIKKSISGVVRLVNRLMGWDENS